MEAIGQSCKDILQANICDYHCAIAEGMQRKTAVDERMAYIVGKDGHSIPVKVSASPCSI